MRIVTLAAAAHVAVPYYPPTIQFWGNGDCYRGDDAAHVVHVDLSAGSAAALHTGKEWLTLASDALAAQTNVRLQLGAAKVVPESCGVTGELSLPDVESIGNGGLHIHMSACAPPGVGGIAYQSGMCSATHNKGIVYAPMASWPILLHEVGHLVGALHPFGGDVAEGATGGVMDYYKVTIDGIVQFSTAQQSSMCSVLDSATCRHPAHRRPVVYTRNGRYASADYALLWFALAAVGATACVLVACWVWEPAVESIR